MASLGVSLDVAPDAPTWEQGLASSLLPGPRSRFRTAAPRYRFGRLIFLHTQRGLEAAWPIERKLGSGGTERWLVSAKPSTDDAPLIWMQRESALVTGPRWRVSVRWPGAGENVLMADKYRTLAWQSRQAAKPGPPVVGGADARPWKDPL